MACVAQFSSGFATLGPVFDSQTQILQQSTAFRPPCRLVHTACFAPLVTANTFCSRECMHPFLKSFRQFCAVSGLLVMDEVHDMITVQFKLTAFKLSSAHNGQLACIEAIGKSH